MKSEKIKYKDQELEIFFFSNPMFHKDWHEAEDAGLVYVWYSHHGPDYWDDELVFAKKEQKELVEQYYKDSMWW